MDRGWLDIYQRGKLAIRVIQIHVFSVAKKTIIKTSKPETAIRIPVIYYNFTTMSPSTTSYSTLVFSASSITRGPKTPPLNRINLNPEVLLSGLELRKISRCSPTRTAASSEKITFDHSLCPQFFLESAISYLCAFCISVKASFFVGFDRYKFCARSRVSIVLLQTLKPSSAAT